MKGKKKPWFKVRKLKRKFKIQFNFLFFFIKLIEKKKTLLDLHACIEHDKFNDRQ
jgi:hypothetical protein